MGDDEYTGAETDTGTEEREAQTAEEQETPNPYRFDDWALI